MQSGFGIGFDLNSPVTWFVVAVALIVLALTLSTRRGNARVRADSPPLASLIGASYAREWAAAQALFIEDPRAGVDRARAIVTGALRASPEADGAPDPLAERYREGCAIAANEKAGTEELRRAFQNFRAVLDDLTKTPSR